MIDKAVDSVYDEVNEESRPATISSQAPAKPKNQKEAARVFRQLMRAGFGAKTIFTILKKWDVDDETLTALEGELE